MAKQKAKAKSSKRKKQDSDSESGGLEPNEYVVERILQAKTNIVQKSAVHWLYLVKWKGYDPAENTWEPARSFVDSEHILRNFWQDADVGGKDYQNPKDWGRGDIVRPLSARQASIKRKSQRESSPQGEESEVETILEEEKQESERSSSPPPPPRKRGRPPRKTVLSLSKKSTRGKATASKSESPARKSISAPLKKRKAIEEVDDSALEDDEEPSKEPAVAIPMKIGPPGKKKRMLKRRFTGPEKSTTNDPPHQDPETQPPENDPIDTPRGGSTPMIAGTPVRRQVQAGQFGSLSQEARSPTDIPNPTDHSDKATSATPPPRPVQVPKTPQHRHRAANPRVRPMDVDELPDASGEKVDRMEKAIPAKAKLAGGERKSSSEASSSKRRSAKRTKPGPGLSSHGLASSQADTLVDDEHPQPPPTDADEDVEEGDENEPPQGGEITKEELMNMVGLREDEDNNLPDFNDEPMDVETEVVQTTVTEITMDKAPAIKERPIAKPSLFGRPNIFGPLSIGAGSSRNLDRNAFALRLDTSVDVSVVLQDMRPGSGSGSVTTLNLKEIFSKTPSAAPGKFYNPEVGSKLLSTLKTGGPCARVELLPGEDEEHEQNWEKFRDRLENKDTFVTGAGVNILVLVASSNVETCETLGVPEILTGLRREIIVSATDVEDASGYSDAADLADNSRWL